jgi:hypothetical protein
MPQQRRRSGLILGLLALGLLAGAALTAGPAQAVDAVGPYYAEPSWDRKMGPVNRFVVLTDWGSAAVLDKETGLVWERIPSPTNNFLWFAARDRCLALTTGTRKGWRLPSIDELTSLLDTTQVGPALPAGHPFVLALPIVNVHWSATTNAADATQAWFANLHNGEVLDFAPKVGGAGNVWCVRGGNNAAAY